MLKKFMTFSIALAMLITTLGGTFTVSADEPVTSGTIKYMSTDPNYPYLMADDLDTLSAYKDNNSFAACTASTYIKTEAASRGTSVTQANIDAGGTVEKVPFDTANRKPDKLALAGYQQGYIIFKAADCDGDGSDEYVKNLKFYVYGSNGTLPNQKGVKVSICDTLGGVYKQVGYDMGNVLTYNSFQSGHRAYYCTIGNLQNTKYVKIDLTGVDANTKLLSVEYDWQKAAPVVDEFNKQNGTVTYSGTGDKSDCLGDTNADINDEVFAETSMALYTNGSFTGYRIDGLSNYGIIKAPEGTTIKNLTAKIYQVGGSLNAKFSVSDTIDGTYTPISDDDIVKENVAQVPGKASNHFYFDYKLSNLQNAHYIKIEHGDVAGSMYFAKITYDWTREQVNPYTELVNTKIDLNQDKGTATASIDYEALYGAGALGTDGCPVSVIVAAYDAQGNMTKAAVSPSTDAMNKLTGKISASISDYAGAAKIKAFLWDGFTKLTPVYNLIEQDAE